MCRLRFNLTLRFSKEMMKDKTLSLMMKNKS
jgi:hypothetical protein